MSLLAEEMYKYSVPSWDPDSGQASHRHAGPLAQSDRPPRPRPQPPLGLKVKTIKYL